MYVLTAPHVGGCFEEVHVELVLLSWLVVLTAMGCVVSSSHNICPTRCTMHHYVTKQPNDKLRRLYELGGLKTGG